MREPGGWGSRGGRSPWALPGAELVDYSGSPDQAHMMRPASASFRELRKSLGPVTKSRAFFGFRHGWILGGLVCLLLACQPCWGSLMSELYNSWADGRVFLRFCRRPWTYLCGVCRGIAVMDCADRLGSGHRLTLGRHGVPSPEGEGCGFWRDRNHLGQLTRGLGTDHRQNM